jgi:DNA invertase Pin-like site-specific DNA recombinase
MNNTAVLWIRVSSEPQSHGYSPEAQEDLLKKAAENLEVVQTFRVTESAKTSENRRRFKEMVEYVKANSVGHLVAYSVDRLSRTYKDLATVQSLVDDQNITIILAGEGKTISKQSGGADRFLFQILGSLAEMDNRKRADATRMGMEKKVRTGGVPGMAPTGYLPVADPADLSGRRRLVVIDPERGPLMKQAFELYAQGKHSLITLCEEMNRRGLTTRPSPKRPAHPITVSHMHKLLKDPFFYGEHEWGGQLWKGNYEPLFAQELFNRVQVSLANHRSYIRPAAKKWFAFKPFLKCGYCGCGITGEEQQGKSGNGHYVYYRCTFGRKITDPDWYKKKFGTDYCIQKYWKEEEIDHLIGEALGQLYIDDFISAKIRERLKKTHIEEGAFEKKELRRLQSEYKRKKNYLDLIYKDRLDGTITKEEYLGKKVIFQRDVDMTQSVIDRMALHNVKYKEQGSEIIELLRGFKDVYLAADLEGKSKILSVMLKQVILKKEGETFFIWHAPFSTLFNLGAVINKRKWGGPIVNFVTYLQHTSVADQIGRLTSVYI